MENLLEKEAFVRGFARGLGSAIRGTKAVTKSVKGFATGSRSAIANKAKALQTGAKAHMGGAKRYVQKNFQAGLKGPQAKGIGYGKAVSTERGMLTRQSNLQAIQKTKAAKLTNIKNQKLERKALKQKGTIKAQQQAAKPLPNQKAKMNQTVNQRINQRAPGVQPKGPAQSNINMIKNAPLQAKATGSKIIRKGKAAWGNLNPMQKNIAKGAVGGTAAVGGAMALSGGNQNQPRPQQGYYR